MSAAVSVRTTLAEAAVQNCSLDGADLSGANLSGMAAEGVDFTGIRTVGGFFYPGLFPGMQTLGP
ncbi:MAG: pentapeptide repeat-containing protein [Syntrophobacterales bacterium]|nr:pentapeptide repeat-containing protein [Syntrophobacterales bacterium]